MSFRSESRHNYFNLFCICSLTLPSDAAPKTSRCSYEPLNLVLHSLTYEIIRKLWFNKVRDLGKFQPTEKANHLFYQDGPDRRQS